MLTEPVRIRGSLRQPSQASCYGVAAHGSFRLNNNVNVQVWVEVSNRGSHVAFSLSNIKPETPPARANVRLDDLLVHQERFGFVEGLGVNLKFLSQLSVLPDHRVYLFYVGLRNGFSLLFDFLYIKRLEFLFDVLNLFSKLVLAVVVLNLVVLNLLPEVLKFLLQ